MALSINKQALADLPTGAHPASCPQGPAGALLIALAVRAANGSNGGVLHATPPRSIPRTRVLAGGLRQKLSQMPLRLIGETKGRLRVRGAGIAQAVLGLAP